MSENKKIITDDTVDNYSSEDIKELIKNSYLVSVKRLKIATDPKEIQSLKEFIAYYENL
jgi:hypothetical protein